jgi:hypothetical protein
MEHDDAMVIARAPDAAPRSASPGPDVCPPETLKALARLARHWLRRGIRRRDAIGAALRRVDPLVDQAVSAGASATPMDHPAARHLAAALDGFQGLEALAQHATLLPWRDVVIPDPSSIAPDHRPARAEIIGPEAPLRHPAFCLGFLVMAPRTLCPLPIGPGVEVHHVVSGQAFRVAGETTEEHRPGDFILLPPDAPRAVRTEQEPLLTIYIRTPESPPAG